MVATTEEPARTTTVAPGSPQGMRGDVDGLRAVAILLVVAYHAGLPLLSGGFIGIDVFFVTSGFLISRHLLAEAETNHRVALVEFWARRVRRLVPALALAIGLTLIASYFILPIYDLDDISRQGAAAALYVSNLYFADQATGYFAADVTTSPFLHTWALGVEAQFYVVWPLLVGLVCWTRRRRFVRRVADFRRRALIVSFALVLLASLALSMRLTAAGDSMAFFGLPARAWEFAAAGLLAAIRLPDWLRRIGLRGVSAVLGLGLIGAAALILDDHSRYPGPWALLPVVGAVLVIVAGETWEGRVPAPGVSNLLAQRPMQWLGRISYSWYIWHWPAIVLLVVAVDDDRVVVRSAAVLLSLPVAILTHHYFEQPVRSSPVLTDSRFRTFGIAVAATVLLLSLASLIRPDGAPLAPTAPVSLAELQAPPGSSIEERVAVAVEQFEQRTESGCPAVGAVTSEDGDVYCVDGDEDGSTTLMLIGDSHAGQWRRPLRAIAEANGIRLLVRQHNQCPPYHLPVDPGEGGTRGLICERQQEGNVRLLERLDPDGVILSTWSGDGTDLRDDGGNSMDPAGQAATWERGMSTLMRIIRAKDIPVGLIQDGPTLPIDASECLVAEDDVDACAVPRDEAFEAAQPLLDAEDRLVAELGDVPVFDTGDVMCDETSCRLEQDGVLVFVDAHHYTDAFAASQLPQLEQLVGQLLS